MLEPFAKDVWIEHRPVRFWGVQVGTRMTVVRLGSGGLFVHSPVALNDDLIAQLSALGEVQAIVAPSKFHHLSVQQWIDAYPNALVCGCPALRTKRPDLRFQQILSDEPETVWATDLDQVYFAARRLEDEVVFFHRTSQTFICADALFNLADHPSRMTRIAARLLANRQPGATWLERLHIRDRRAAREQVGRMLQWDIDSIVLAHGAVVPEDGRQVLESAYEWL